MAKRKENSLLIEGLRRIGRECIDLAEALEGKPSAEESDQTILEAESSDKDVTEEAVNTPPDEPTSKEEVAQTADETPPVNEEAAPAEPKNYTFEEVRALFAELSDDGYTDQVREIVHNHGAAKLSDIPKNEYAAAVAEARALKGADANG